MLGHSKPLITKTTSNTGHVMLVIDGYTLQFNNFSTDKNVKFWPCAVRDCGVLLRTNLSDDLLPYSG